MDRFLAGDHLADIAYDFAVPQQEVEDVIRVATRTMARSAARASRTPNGWPFAGSRGWVVLMKDDAIRRRPAEIEALRVASVRAFCLTNANLRASEQSERFVVNRHRIIQRATKPGPFIDGVYPHGLRRLWPRA